MRSDGNRTHPIQGHKVPRQRPRNSTNMDQAWRSRVAEVRKAEIEEIDDDEQERKPEMTAHPEVHEAEEEEIGRDVVGADVGGGGDVGSVRGVEGEGVNELEDEEDEPVMR